MSQSVTGLDFEDPKPKTQKKQGTSDFWLSTGQKSHWLHAGGPSKEKPPPKQEKQEKLKVDGSFHTFHELWPLWNCSSLES